MQRSEACQAYAGSTVINTQEAAGLSPSHSKSGYRNEAWDAPILISSPSPSLCLSTNTDLKRKESYLRTHFGISVECKATRVCPFVWKKNTERIIGASYSPVLNKLRLNTIKVKVPACTSSFHCFLFCFEMVCYLY